MKLLGMQIGDSEARAHFLVSGGDIFALGHYAGNPIFPGVLTAGHLCTLAEEHAVRILGDGAYVAGLKRVQYLDAILPGDVVEVSARIKKHDATTAEISAVAVVAGKPKTRGTVVCVGSAPPAAAAGCPEMPLRGPGVVEHRELASILPHRYPFLLVDRIYDYESGSAILASKLVTRTLPALLEMDVQHYPQSLIVESIGQAGIALFFLSRKDEQPRDIVLGAVSDVEFVSAVPFDTALTLRARIDRLVPNGVMFSGEALIGDRVVTRVGSLLAMIDPRHG